MCFSGCGSVISLLLDDSFNEFKKQQLLPKDARLIIDPEPHGLGIHKLKIFIESESNDPNFSKKNYDLISSEFKQCLTRPDPYSGDASSFQLVNPEETQQKEASNITNWINIAINIVAILTIITLSFIFPPSILLTVILTAISFLATAFTARDYLINFYRNCRNKDFKNMTTTVFFGWLLSLAHTLFHVIVMPLASSFTMVFMSFLMPVMLITFINGMDEIKRLILNKSKKMNLEGLKTLFPQMSEKYSCYQLSKERSAYLSECIFMLEKKGEFLEFELVKEMINELNDPVDEAKNLLQEGMVIQIKSGECFPVDCILLEENTLVDASVMTGEPRQPKKFMDKIPAGAINFGKNVKVYATKNPYNSTITRLLFPANRARENPETKSISKFTYLYSALIIVGIITAIIFPVALGVFTIPLLLQNVMGIAFSVCFCTIAIALQLPGLVSVFHRSKKGIQLRDENIGERIEEMHTIIFDKTGTLTTGESMVESTDIESAALWQRIYLLEKEQGAEHPLAKAIMNYHTSRASSNIVFNQVENSILDSQNRGLSAIVQGKFIHIGNKAFLQEFGIELPNINQAKIEQGFSPVYVAEDYNYQGVIYIKHEVRPGIIAALSRLKSEKKKIIMLTGDSKAAALGFNNQIGAAFDEVDIHADQTPENKKLFVEKLMKTDPKGIVFVGDGLNDAPVASIVSKKGGLSCAMNAYDKTAFFTDISLNGSIDYLFSHNKVNQFLQKIVLQNKAILAFSSAAFIAFIISFSIVGISVSPFIPLIIMLSTTLFVLFNSYRTQLSIDVDLDQSSSWPKKLLASDLSIILLIAASSLLIGAILISTIATGGLAFPVIVFTAGATAVWSSICIIGAISLFSLFTVLVSSYFLTERCKKKVNEEELDFNPIKNTDPEPSSHHVYEKEIYSSEFRLSSSYRVAGENSSTKEESWWESAVVFNCSS